MKTTRSIFAVGLGVVALVALSQGRAVASTGRAAMAVSLSMAMALSAAAPANVDQAVHQFEIAHPPKASQLEKPSGHSWWKFVSGLWHKVVDWILDQITKGINFVKKKVLGKIKEMFAAITKKVVDGAKKLLEGIFAKVVKPIIEAIPFDEIEQIADLFRGATLDKEKVRQKVFDIVMAFVRPHIKPRVMEAFQTVFATVKQFLETGVSAACSIVAEVPFVGGVIGGAILLAFSFLFDFTVNTIMTELLRIAEQSILKPLIMKLLDPLLGKIVGWVNKALRVTGLGKVLQSAKDVWGKIKNAAVRMKALTGELYEKAKTISAALQKELDDAARERLAAEHEIEELRASLKLPADLKL